MLDKANFVDNNSSANIRPPSPTQEQVRLGAAAANVHASDIVDAMEHKAFESPSPSRPSTPTLTEGLQTPRSASSASTRNHKTTISDELEGSYVDVEKASSEKAQAGEDKVENVELPKKSEDSTPEKSAPFSFASRITSFFGSLGQRFHSGVEAAENFLVSAKSTFIDIGKSIIESVNKMITALSPR